VVRDNMEAVRRGYREVLEVPREIMLAGAPVGSRSASAVHPGAADPSGPNADRRSPSAAAVPSARTRE